MSTPPPNESPTERGNRIHREFEERIQRESNYADWEFALYKEIFNPEVSDLDYLRSRLRHHGLDKPSS